MPVPRPHERPQQVTSGDDPLNVLFVTCPECGCIGPEAAAGNPLGTAGRL